MPITRSMILARLAPCLLPSLLVAQVPMWASETKPDMIVMRYKQRAPYRTVELQSIEKGPFLFLVEGKDEKRAKRIVDERAHALEAVIAYFESRFAKPLGLKPHKRVLPFWILKDRKSYTVFGGNEFSGAFFSPVDLHSVTYEDMGRGKQQTFRTSIHEAVHQIMNHYTAKGYQVATAAFSGWLGEGMAEYLSSRPDEPLVLGRDPGFGWLNERRVESFRRRIEYPVHWRRRSSLERKHHPLVVMHYKFLSDYMQATGHPRKPRTPAEKQAYHLQMMEYYASAYSIVAFLDLAYSGHYRGALLEILEREYGAGKDQNPMHGAAVLSRVFPTAEERRRMIERFEAFVRDPGKIAKAKLPAEPFVVRLDHAMPIFEDPDDEVLYSVDIALALASYARLDASDAIETLEELDDDALAKQLLASSRALAKIIADHPVPAGRPVDVADWVERVAGGKAKLNEAEQQAVALLLYLTKIAAGTDSPLGKRVAAIGENGGFRLAATLQGDEDGLEEDSQKLALEVALVLERAGADLKTTKDRDAALTALAKRLKKLDAGEEKTWLVRELVPSILNAACKAELSQRDWTDAVDGLRGRVDKLPDGRIRVRYDWSSSDQLADWLLLDPIQCDFRIPQLGAVDPGWKDAKLSVERGRLVLSGPGLIRHRFQLAGEVTVEASSAPKGPLPQLCVAARPPMRGVVLDARAGRSAFSVFDAGSPLAELELDEKLAAGRSFTLAVRGKRAELRVSGAKPKTLAAPGFENGGGVVLGAFGKSSGFSVGSVTIVGKPMFLRERLEARRELLRKWSNMFPELFD